MTLVANVTFIQRSKHGINLVFILLKSSRLLLCYGDSWISFSRIVFVLFNEIYTKKNMLVFYKTYTLFLHLKSNYRAPVIYWYLLHLFYLFV